MTIGGWVSAPVVVSAIGVIAGLVMLFCVPIGRKFIIAGRSKVFKTTAAWLLGIVTIALLLSHAGLNRWGVVLPSAWLSIPTVASIALIAAAVLALSVLPPGRRLIAQGGAVSMLAILIAYALILVSVVLFLRGLVYERVLLPFPALVLLAVVVIAAYISFFTAFGRNLYAVGGNEEAAHLMGLPVGRTKMLVYMVSGLCAAIAAIVMTVYQPAGDPIGATGMELDAIAVAVIGGTLLTGGAGNVFGTFIGVLIFGIIPTGIGMEGSLSSYWARVAIGSLLLIFVVLQRFLSAGAYRKD